MIKHWIEFILTLLRAIFKLKNNSAQEQAAQEAIQNQQLQEQQQQLQNQYNKIDEQHQVDPNMSLQDIEDKLNDRFKN